LKHLMRAKNQSGFRGLFPLLAMALVLVFASAPAGNSNGRADANFQRKAPIVSPEWPADYRVPDPAPLPGKPDAQQPFRLWARQQHAYVQKAFYDSSRQLYLEKAEERKSEAAPAFAWSAAIQLQALASFTCLNGEARELMRAYAQALVRQKWDAGTPLGGFEAFAAGLEDKYIDDNAWMGIALLDAYEATQEKWYLEYASRVKDFLIARGQDEQLGGGFYWHASKHRNLPDRWSCQRQIRRGEQAGLKATSATAGAVLFLLRYRLLTSDEQAEALACRALCWLHQRLRDPQDGLYWDKAFLDGSVDKTKYIYNSAVVARAWLALHRLHPERGHLSRARRLIAACERAWWDPQRGLPDNLWFSSTLVEAWIDLYWLVGDRTALARAQRQAVIIHSAAREKEGYGKFTWSDPTAQPQELLYNATMTRIYSLLAKATGRIAPTSCNHAVAPNGRRTTKP